MQLGNQNTYNARPVTREVFGQNPEIDQVTQEALGYALDAHPVDPTNVDPRRTEYGASAVAAANKAPSAEAVVERWWENPEILARFSKGTTYYRGQALLDSQSKAA